MRLMSFVQKIQWLISDYNKFSRDSSLLIYQPGKVGSVALESSIEDSVHVHTFYGNSPCWVAAKYRSPGILGFTKSKVKFWFRRFAIAKRKRTKVISVVRDPLSRNISMFFQELAFWIICYQLKYDPDMRHIDEEFLLDVFSKAFDHEYINNWFDKEIKKLTGIDVLSEGFDKDRGYSIYSNANFDLLVVKIEHLEDLTEVIRNFSGKSVDLEKHNDSSRKWYGPIYKGFKSMLFNQCDRDFFVQMYDSRYSKVFGYEFDS